MKYGVPILVVVLLLFGMFAFGTCYSEHKEQGFSTWTSVISCSG